MIDPIRHPIPEHLPDKPELPEKKKIEITATFDDDSKRYHRFTIDEAQGITGAVYVPKGGEVPDLITVRLRTKAEAEREKEAGKNE